MLLQNYRYHSLGSTITLSNIILVRIISQSESEDPAFSEHSAARDHRRRPIICGVVHHYPEQTRRPIIKKKKKTGNITRRNLVGHC